ncbi:hypothetical protein WMF27_24495 [Sorangium sp. So ce281]|uniref:hypothetical protein n=1 Tax=unclassified Sorangium TaxID=2621164 RepID=UPI003F63AF40
MRSAGAAPAGVSGLLLAIPITGNVLPCFTLPRHGAAATVTLLRGFVRGLLGFASFFAALHAGLAWSSPAAAYVLAWLCALLAALALRRANTPPRPTRDRTPTRLKRRRTASAGSWPTRRP